jgi:hypothetical protein
MYVQYSEPYPESRGDRFGATAGRTQPHRGQDTAPGGLPAQAVADGVVYGTRWDPAMGNVVVLAHADGKFSGYGHLLHRAIAVGARVSRLGNLPTIGATGTAAKGRHLHYTLGSDPWGIIAGHVEDPLAWIGHHTAPAPAVLPAGGTDWLYWEPPKGMGLALRVQRALKNRGRYAGALDDEFGPLSRKGVQLTLKVSGVFNGQVDGVIGAGGCQGIQVYARRFGNYGGPIDRKLGPGSWSGFALGLERP